jgi:hypothetical protein
VNTILYLGTGVLRIGVGRVPRDAASRSSDSLLELTTTMGYLCRKEKPKREAHVERYRPLLIMLALVMASLCSSAKGTEQGEGMLARTLYVPVYSHLYGAPRSHALNLTTTLMVRNTDPRESIEVLSIRYYDSQGRMVKEFLTQPMRLAPLASTHVIVGEADESGGPGPSFLVKWSGKTLVNLPLVEGIMITTKSGLGLSFLTHGVEIHDRSH